MPEKPCLMCEHDFCQCEFDAYSWDVDLRDKWVRELYTEEGTRIWIADAEKKGRDITEQLQRLAQLRDGAYA